MILADKLIELRKRNGWSQEELAEMLDVSRQSISKWEGAQSVPDMNRILKLSEIFGVSTDVLLKDELDLPGSEPPYPLMEDAAPLRSVSMEEASEFLSYKERASRKISLGVMMCILSPVLIMLLSGLQDQGLLLLSEAQAAGIGMIALFGLIGGAVALFVTTGLAGSRYEYLEKEPIDTAYGVDGMVRERMERFRGTRATHLVVGIVLCVVSVIPVVVAALFTEGNKPVQEAAAIIGSAVLFILVAVGVFLIVRCSVIWGGYQRLLQEGDYTVSRKVESKRNDRLSTIYWCLVVTAYLAVSFLTGAWHRTWIIWPVAGVAYGAVTAIAGAIRKD